MGELYVLPAHELGEFLIYDLDDLLGGGEGGKDLRPHGTLGHFFDKVFYQGIVDVGFQKRHAHIAHCFFYVRFRELAATGKLFERALYFFGKAFKRHGIHRL